MYSFTLKWENEVEHVERFESVRSLKARLRVLGDTSCSLGAERGENETGICGQASFILGNLSPWLRECMRLDGI